MGTFLATSISYMITTNQTLAAFGGGFGAQNDAQNRAQNDAQNRAQNLAQNRAQSLFSIENMVFLYFCPPLFALLLESNHLLLYSASHLSTGGFSSSPSWASLGFT